MKRLRVGVMGCSSFAQRAMIPGMKQCDDIELVAVASRSAQKASETAAVFGCDAVAGYDALLKRDDIEAVYMPLPTGLHTEWCPRVLQSGRHLLVEKSFSSSRADAERMVALAVENKCLILENFQFQTHSSWARIHSAMTSGEIGDVHLVRSTFGFPPLPRDNFRWNREMGGGALLDAGAYMVKVSQLLLGLGLEVRGASLQMDESTGVDIYGEALFRNARGQAAQVAFGFDFFYQCRVELLGTKGKLSSGRVFTAPPDYVPTVQIETSDGSRVETLTSDNHYVNMWRHFARAVRSGDYRVSRETLLDQARLLDEIRSRAQET